tara:strand:- start:179 stop:805 length:627 start_codon:yes stop_codon:yes gene_type:complete
MDRMRDKIKQVIDLCSEDGVYVNDRGQRTVSAWSKIKYFRQVFGSDYGVQFKIMEHSDRAVIMKCIISTKDPEFVMSEAYAKVYRDKPGYLEIAQTFAFTRALTYLGILDDDLTSKEEYDALGLNIRKESKEDQYVSAMSDTIDVEEIKNSFKQAVHLPRLKYLREVVHKDGIDFLLKNSLRDYRQVDDIYQTREHQLASESNFTAKQ